MKLIGIHRIIANNILDNVLNKVDLLQKSYLTEKDENMEYSNNFFEILEETDKLNNIIFHLKLVKKK